MQSTSPLRQQNSDNKGSENHSPWRFCTAPMMDWSDRHCRYFWRLMSSRTRLYTEMVTTGALRFGDRQRFLQHHPAEYPLALQLGGNDPAALAECAKMAEDAGYQEVNLNCGCPSDRVQEGRIGACLMAEPVLVGDCLNAMQNAVDIPVTVKHRMGIDDLDTTEYLHQFVDTLVHAGCKVFIVHARKAWLNGLSPKENREIPPLQYDEVAQLKNRFPAITVVINGGIENLEDSRELLNKVDGVMLGRQAYHNPYILESVDQTVFGLEKPSCHRHDILERYMNYCAEQLSEGVRLHHLTRHILGLFAAQPGGRLFRQHLSTHASKPGATLSVLREALQLQSEQQKRWEMHQQQQQ